MRIRVMTLTLILVCLVVFLGMPLPAFAAGHSSLQRTNWQQYDTGAYVVSTVNLLDTSYGRPLPGLWRQAFGIDRFDVYTDTTHPGLFYIELRKGDGTSAGTLVYELDWPTPRPLRGDIPGLRRAGTPLALVRDYRVDRKVLIGAFDSTLPTPTPIRSHS